MTIRFHCPECQVRIKVPDGTEGKSVKCPRCGSIQKIPQAAGEVVHAQAGQPSNKSAGHDPEVHLTQSLDVEDANASDQHKSPRGSGEQGSPDRLSSDEQPSQADHLVQDDPLAALAAAASGGGATLAPTNEDVEAPDDDPAPANPAEALEGSSQDHGLEVAQSTQSQDVEGDAHHAQSSQAGGDEPTTKRVAEPRRPIRIKLRPAVVDTPSSAAVAESQGQPHPRPAKTHASPVPIPLSNPQPSAVDVDDLPRPTAPRPLVRSKRHVHRSTYPLLVPAAWTLRLLAGLSLAGTVKIGLIGSQQSWPLEYKLLSVLGGCLCVVFAFALGEIALATRDGAIRSQ